MEEELETDLISKGFLEEGGLGKGFLKENLREALEGELEADIDPWGLILAPYQQKL
jgi:hypothetical protein